VLKVRLYRPLDAKRLVRRFSLDQSIAVLDRTKERQR
jgi:pyruvate/2-oxoacid:ferredoxin oxidoreductase alpha subunit